MQFRSLPYILSILAVPFILFPESSYSQDHQDYPNRPITMVVPYPAGGIADIGGRVLAKELSARLKQPVLVDNKAGGSGIIGAEYVANAKPDGYTLLSAATGTLVLAPVLREKLSYSPSSFENIYGTQVTPLMIAVRADSPYKSVADVVAAAKKKPEALTFATIGNGSIHHILAELWQTDADMKLMHVPYKGAAPAFVDFLGGRIDVMIDYQMQLIPLASDGKIRILAVAAPERVPALPNVPTFSELGYKSVLASAFGAIVAPAGTPKPIIKKIADAFEDMFKTPEIKKYIEERGSQTLGLSGDKLDAYLKDEVEKAKQVAIKSGIKLDD